MKPVTSKLWLLPVLLSLICLQSCTRSAEISMSITISSKYRLTKITSNYFNQFTDTSSYYTVNYANSLVSGLTGKWNDQYHFYSNTNAFNRIYVPGADSCVYDNSGSRLQSAARYTNATVQSMAQLQYPSSTTGLVTYTNQGNVTGRARINYDYDGDISSMGVYDGNADTLLYTINVSYTSAHNKLQECYKNFTLIDPFSSAYGIDKNTGKGFPVNIHYGIKCISSYTVVNKDGSSQSHSVSYDSNLYGYITAIYIDGRLFMSFEYEPA